MDPRLKAYIAGLEERMAEMTPAQRRKIISAIHRAKRESVEKARSRQKA
jgi:uncharacterized protein YdeI (YjbR/CyaY-like superfamily)